MSWELSESSGDGFVLLVGDAQARLKEFSDGVAQVCVTSPPYWRLRDYGHRSQIGLEKDPSRYVQRLVDVFREVRRVLREDGTLWLNIGDCYAASANGSTGRSSRLTNPARYEEASLPGRSKTGNGLKRKDLVGIPWMLAFALREDGWFLRSEIIWHKPSPVPESVRDRPTKAHEQVFLLSKSSTYFFDAAAIGEQFKSQRQPMAVSIGQKSQAVDREHLERSALSQQPRRGWANARDVWSISAEPTDLGHFAPMPSELARRCIVAGSAGGGLVLDPFAGSGTTALVALREGRRFAGVELNPNYAAIASERVRGVTLGLGLGGAA